MILVFLQDDEITRARRRQYKATGGSKMHKLIFTESSKSNVNHKYCYIENGEVKNIKMKA